VFERRGRGAARCELADERKHLDDHARVIVEERLECALDDHGAAEFLGEFAQQRAAGSFARLDFAAGKFPCEPEVFIGGPLGNQDAAGGVLNDGADDGNRSGGGHGKRIPTTQKNPSGRNAGLSAAGLDFLRGTGRGGGLNRGMAKSAEQPQAFIRDVSLVGRSGGLVKSLAGFKKAHHTVPDAVNPATSAFLAKLCAEELAAEGEKFFQAAKTALGYKRAQLSPAVASPTAALVAKDFTREWSYALEPADPARYTVTRTLHSLRTADLVEVAEFDALFTGQFSAVVFALKKGVRVEAVIDAVEGLDPSDEAAGVGLSVEYPSDCRSCTLRAAGVDAAVTCDGATLAMQFARGGSPRELVAGFAELRRAFALTKARVLAGML